MDPPTLVAQGYRHRAVLAEVVVVAEVMVVWGHPAHPHTRGVLTGEHPDRVVVLEAHTHTHTHTHTHSITSTGVQEIKGPIQ